MVRISDFPGNAGTPGLQNFILSSSGVQYSPLLFSLVYSFLKDLFSGNHF